MLFSPLIGKGRKTSLAIKLNVLHLQTGHSNEGHFLLRAPYISSALSFEISLLSMIDKY